MAPIVRRRRLVWTGTLSVLLTLLSAALDWAGHLTTLEDFLHKQRVTLCQWHVPKPTDRLVHLDIDDNVVDQVGRWPWDRDRQAEIFEEIRAAGPKVLALDVLYAEPSGRARDESGRRIDRDGVLADVVRKFGRALVPVSLDFSPPALTSPLERRLSGLLAADPELTIEQCAQHLRSAGFDAPDLDESVSRLFLSVRPQAMYERIHGELTAGEPADAPAAGALPLSAGDRARLRSRLLPHADPRMVSVLDHLFDEQYDRVTRERSLWRFTLPIPPGLPPVLRSNKEITPILPLSDAAAFSAFVDYLPQSSDGTVRSVPLVADYRGRLVPHMGLVTACAMLDVDVHQLRLGPDSVVIPRPGGRDIVIPVGTRTNTRVGTVGMLMEIPLFGKKDSWETMYDWPSYRTPYVRHVSVNEVWRICLTRQRMSSNEDAANRALARAQARLGTPDADPLHGEAQRKRIQETLEAIADVTKNLDAPDLDADSKALCDDLQDCAHQLRAVLKQNDALKAQRGQLRAALRDKLNGRAVFLGGTFTGNVDKQPTSLHYACPGVIVHGAVFNAIMTGRMWRVAPGWTSPCLTLALGLLAGLVTSRFSPTRGSVVSAALVGVYLLVNGCILFDYNCLVVGAAGPTVAVVALWFGVTLSNFVAEVAERVRITRRFRNYVDPSLVDYVLKHPDRDVFSGEVREMTVVFTDLAGFTAVSEKLGRDIIPVLNELMGLISAAAKRHNGFVNKFMGDGVMFFFNAPEPNPHHARDAMAAVLDIRLALAEFNARTAKRGLPALSLRAGICTGTMVVGDAGSAERSDYTVLGDNVNLAARLESANKATGTGSLVVERTLELAGDEFLVRPVAKLCVVGKTQAVMTYEILARADQATAEQKRLAAMTREMVDAFLDARPADCLEAVARLEDAFGESKLSHLYQDKCLRYLQDPAAGELSGQIALTEK